MFLSYYTYRTLYTVNVLANPTTYYGKIYAIFWTYLIYASELLHLPHTVYSQRSSQSNNILWRNICHILDIFDLWFRVITPTAHCI